MKVLKKGKIDDKWIGICIKCYSIIECKERELHNKTLGDFRTNYEDFSWEDCMVCNNKTSINFHRQSSNTGKKLLEKVNDR